tara:strand:- start:2508 stop:2669 length:162 start_codon:yes stop_codon:yes gene_type:complete
MRLTERERDILQDLVKIEYRNDTTHLAAYQGMLATIFGKLAFCKLTEEKDDEL